MRAKSTVEIIHLLFPFKTHIQKCNSIRNLPLDATDDQLEAEFNKFGSIKQNGVQVRSNKVALTDIISMICKVIQRGSSHYTIRQEAIQCVKAKDLVVRQDNIFKGPKSRQVIVPRFEGIDTLLRRKQFYFLICKTNLTLNPKNLSKQA
ncbi:RNA recognition motif domain [Forsythia ovata]|uniref:RNA recognition motif domain n=1 Tax=Forsythia ovata TaxID=205694 RepID=A0ABD1RMH2_9LAMI